MGGDTPASAKTDTSLVQNQNSGVWAALKDMLHGDFKAAVEAVTPSTRELAKDLGPARDLSTDRSLPVSAVRDNSGLLGNASRAIISRGDQIKALEDEAMGTAPPAAPPPKAPGSGGPGT